MELKPTVGMGGTYGIGSDAYPVTVREISKSGHRLVATEDDSRVVRGSAADGSAEWECTPNTQGPRVVFTLRKDGRYRVKGWSNSGTLYLGHRRRHYDPHF